MPPTLQSVKELQTENKAAQVWITRYNMIQPMISSRQALTNRVSSSYLTSIGSGPIYYKDRAWQIQYWAKHKPQRMMCQGTSSWRRLWKMDGVWCGCPESFGHEPNGNWKPAVNTPNKGNNNDESIIVCLGLKKKREHITTGFLPVIQVRVR